MFSMQPSLKRGFSAWDQAVMPRDEYMERVRATQQRMRDDGLQALIVFGDQYEDADLSYLIGGRIEGAVIVTGAEEPAVLSLAASREQYIQRVSVWLDDVRCVGAALLGKSLADHLKSEDIASGRIGTVGLDGLPARLHDSVISALGGFELVPFDDTFRRQRSVPRSREIYAVEIATGIAEKAAVAGLKVFNQGGSSADAYVEAERVARRERAYDVRIMANMGADELRPFDEAGLPGSERLFLWVAVSFQGYWGEAAIAAGAGITDAAEKAVQAMCAAASAGARARDVAEAGLASLPKAAAEAAMVYGLGGGTGLSLVAGPGFVLDSEDRLVEGKLVLLHVLSCAPECPSFANVVARVTSDGAVPLRARSR